MSNNKLIIASAGSGKTTTLINEALKIHDKNVLITTFTEANQTEIRKKFIKKNGCIPSNVTIQTWFSFLLQHGVRPYQGDLFEKRVSGLILVNGKSAKYVKKENIESYYFSDKQKIYSDKLSAFVCECNRKSDGKVVQRLTTIYPYIFIDEVQDLAGYDLEILKLFFQSSSDILLVGDPRQGTYSTNNAAKNKKFAKSQIIHFFEDKEIVEQLEIDSTSLTINYRCNQNICDFSNKLFPKHENSSSGQAKQTSHDGVFLIKETDIDNYLAMYPNCIQLRDSLREKRIKENRLVMNFGNSKGLNLQRILIYPTQPILKWVKDNTSELAPTSRCKLYVAITRAKYSVGIVYNYKDDDVFEGIEKYHPTSDY